MELDIGEMPTKEELEIATFIGESLTRHYPGYSWCVNVNGAGGIATIQLDLSGKWGFVLHISQLVGDPDLKRVMRAGGELLERYNLKRGMANEYELTNAYNNMGIVHG